LAQRVESTGTGGDRSINSLCSRQLLKSSSLLKNEKKKEKKKKKKKKKKNKRNPEVIGRGDDEIGDVKTKEKWFENWFGKQNEKKDELCGEEGENKSEQRGR